MSELRWVSFDAVWYLLGILILVLFYFVFKNQNKKKLNKAFGEKIIPWLTRSVSDSALLFKLVLQSIALFFVVMALMRPQAGQSQQEIKSEGVELMILADVSDSMLAEDIKPSRLDIMKIELERLVDMMPGNKMGLIAFAGSSALMSPLTSDPSALKMYIQALDTNSVSSQGTNFQLALEHAQEAFEKGGVTQDQNSKATRVVLIMSDGEDHESKAIDEAKKMAEKGVFIITVAYGTEKGGTIPARDQMGNLLGTRKGKDGQPIITQVKGDFLKTLAQESKGQFFVARYGGDHLQDIVRGVDQYEKAQFATSMNIQYDEKFQIPLTIAIVFIFLSFLFSARAFKTNKSGLYQALIILFLFTSCQNQHVDFMRSYYHDKKAMKLLNQKETEKAQVQELLAKEYNEKDYHIDSNLGIILNKLNKNEEAGKSFLSALKNIQQSSDQDSSAKDLALYQVYFNLGVLYGSQKKIDQALQYYQMALDLQPTSQEVKTNIELLIQKQQNESKENKKGEGNGQSSSSDQQQQNNQDKKDQDKEKDQNQQQKEQQQKQDRQENKKYQPRPFKGDQLSEGDVKKILGELGQQDRKIRSQFENKEENKNSREENNDKDW